MIENKRINFWFVLFAACVFAKAAVVEAQSERRRPGAESTTRRERQEAPSAQTGGATSVAEAEMRELTRPKSAPLTSYQGTDFTRVPNRWRLLYSGNWYDPYNQNVLKGDIKAFGSDADPWFVELKGLSDTLFETRNSPTPVAITSTRGPGKNDVFGSTDQNFFNENFLLEFALIKGNTTFKPPDLEFRLAPIFNANYVDVDEYGVLRADPTRGSSRSDASFSLAAAFVDYHIANLSERYDFVSVRAGVQEFNADFRGLLFIEEQPGVRLFGNCNNNTVQWNLAYFHRLQKDANSLLPILFESRREDVIVANTYWQDLIALGHTVEFLLAYRNDQFDDRSPRFDDNNQEAAPASTGNERPKSINNYYLGLNGDGHFGRVNMNSAFYYAFGSESNNNFADQSTDINAYLAALELSVDIDWARPRVSFLWSSGDDDPFDDEAGGFAPIFDNPNFAGGERTYWTRQAIPFIGGGGVTLVNRNSFYPSLDGGKALGQKNFVNPGLILYNAGVDFDVAPKLIWENNVNYLQFDTTETLQVARQDGSVSRNIGLDVSTSFLYRPLLSNNIQFEVGYAHLFPSAGFEGLFGDRTYNQFFGNMTLFY